MENNEIMEKLMQNDVHSESKENTTSKETEKGGASQLPRIRVITAKYKLLIVILLILICILLYLIPGVQNTKKNTQNAYDAKKQELIRVEADIQAAKNDMNLLTDIVSNESNIRECLNGGDTNMCNQLPQDWQKETTDEEAVGEGDTIENVNIIEKYNLAIPLSFLQTHSLYNEKMSVDEKTILKNLNEYLIKHDISGQEKQIVGQILRISIGETEVLGQNKGGEDNFFKVPVDVEIEFETVGDLIDFLYNIEKKIVDNREDRILYKIQTVSYDIIANDEPQITDISMIAYYYYDEAFLENDEYSEKAEDNSIESNQKVEEKKDSSTEKKDNSKKSNSFLDIFK